MKKVSILVPTRNRYLFIPQLVRNIRNQDYDKNYIEVIIADDSLHSIKKMLPDSYIYIRYNNTISIGKKRQDLKDMATGDIMVCFDDDDYYPPNRISHSVEMFNKYKNIDFAFSPSFYCLFKEHNNNIFLSGPWLKNWGHATFSFTKKYALNNHYDINDKYGEEKKFTNYYNVPYIKLDPLKTILVLIHKCNTIPKNNLGKLIKTNYNIDNFIINKTSKLFYHSIKYISMGPSLY